MASADESVLASVRSGSFLIDVYVFDPASSPPEVGFDICFADTSEARSCLISTSSDWCHSTLDRPQTPIVWGHSAHVLDPDGVRFVAIAGVVPRPVLKVHLRRLEMNDEVQRIPPSGVFAFLIAAPQRFRLVAATRAGVAEFASGSVR